MEHFPAQINNNINNDEGQSEIARKHGDEEKWRKQKKSAQKPEAKYENGGARGGFTNWSHSAEPKRYRYKNT